MIYFLDNERYCCLRERIVQLAEDKFSWLGLSNPRLDQALDRVYVKTIAMHISPHDEALLVIPSLYVSRPLRNPKNQNSDLANAYFALVVGLEWSGYKLLGFVRPKLQLSGLAVRICDSGVSEEVLSEFRDIRAQAIKARNELKKSK